MHMSQSMSAAPSAMPALPGYRHEMKRLADPNTKMGKNAKGGESTLNGSR